MGDFLGGLRDYLKDVAWFLYLIGLRIGAVRIGTSTC